MTFSVFIKEFLEGYLMCAKDHKTIPFNTHTGTEKVLPFILSKVLPRKYLTNTA